MRNNRKPISKGLRFNVFKRDSFQCVYCGNRPPSVLLEVDHIIPVSKGGLNKIENLVTSCINCNRGKSNKELSEVPKSVLDDEKKEKLSQYKEYIKYVKGLKKIKDTQIGMVCDVYESYIEGYTPSEKFRFTISEFIDKLGVEEVIHAMNISCSRFTHKKDSIFKYFCGVCHNKLRNNRGYED